ncbi:hypothetical protein C8R46DRAFT_1165079 [Mycena filopes]|nr:hypothetical protein C8R46DRAFT_1165079 [Mycena filopes]
MRPPPNRKTSPTPDSPKKPRKSTTPLRRSASASLPIRTNPTPTRSSIQTVFTLATAERYLLSRMRTHPKLPSLANSQKFHDAWWFSRWGKGREGSSGEVFVFANGSFVCWGLEEDEAHRFALEVIGSVPGIEVAPLRAPETEELEFVVDPIETTRLQGDLIILGQAPQLNEVKLASYPAMTFPSETLFARYAFSQALSRSTALSALEVALDERASPAWAAPALVKKLGELMKFRQGLNLNRENFSDVPDFYWTEPELESGDALDVKVRTDSVNDKITYAAEVRASFSLLPTPSTHSMELVIIALIAVEVSLWEMFTGGKHDTEKSKVKMI